LLDACTSNDIKIFELFLPYISIDSESNWLPCMKALINYGFTKAIELFSERFPSVDINSKDENGNTVLHYAVNNDCIYNNLSEQKRLTVLKQLISLFPNININGRNNDAFTPFQLAWIDGRISIIQYVSTLPNCEPLSLFDTVNDLSF
jgi:ankyrin repeat protein